MKRIQHVVFFLAVAAFITLQSEESRAFGAFTYWLGQGETNCDGGFDGPGSPPYEPYYIAQCICQAESEDCNDYVTNDWAGQAQSACEEFCSTNFCDIQYSESVFSGGSYYGYAICSCFPKCEGNPPYCAWTCG